MLSGKEVPALIVCTTKDSITSEILKEDFKRLDDLNVYPRTASLTPMALFDAHDRRLQVPFLRYVKNPEHLWNACIDLYSILRGKSRLLMFRQISKLLGTVTGIQKVVLC